MVPAFTGFPPGFALFFAGLAQNQSRDWFEAHKADYETSVKAPLASLVADASAMLRGAGIELWGDPKQSVFRIHRDVRFARDKTPYKTHASALLTRNGSKKDRGILYMHFDPTGSFLAAGFHSPEPPVLAELRDQIIDRPDRFRALRDSLQAQGLVFGDAERLIRLPKGYDHVTEPDLADAIRLKGYVVRRAIAPDRIASRAVLDDVFDFGRRIDPLIEWGRGA